MVLKYGEIYVYHNKNEESIGNTFWRFFGYETPVDKSSQILMIFNETNELFDISEYLSRPNTECKIKLNFSDVTLPDYFKNSVGKTATYKEPIVTNGVKKESFTKIFTNYDKYKNFKPIASIYNRIYTFNSDNVFGTLRISSAEETPRFIFAFESDFLSNTDVVYLINLFFRGNL